MYLPPGGFHCASTRLSGKDWLFYLVWDWFLNLFLSLSEDWFISGLPFLFECSQWCAGYWMTDSQWEGFFLVAFAHFHNVNTSTAASFQLPVWHTWTWNWEEMPIVRSCELVESHIQCTSSGPHLTFCGAYQGIFVSPGSWECWRLCIVSKSLSFCLAPQPPGHCLQTDKHVEGKSGSKC